MTTTNYSLGTLSSTPIKRNTFLDSTFDKDVYKFNLTGTNNINLNLRNISSGDDADLRLYQDSNFNGIFDSGDNELSRSRNLSNNDDSINYRANSGTYFAVVESFSLGNDNRLTYNLDSSATGTSQASNLLPREVKVGNLSGDRTFSNWVGNSDTTDTYAFSLDSWERVDIRLSGLSSDADIRVIRDFNGNRVVDSGEVLSVSSNAGTSSDLLSVSGGGNYFLQVYQFSGDTSYQVTFDHSFV